MMRKKKRLSRKHGVSSACPSYSITNNTDTKDIIMAQYNATFHLDNAVNDIEAARNYLADEDMAHFLPDNLAEFVTSVFWRLQDEESGYINIEADRELTDDESAQMSQWISGQCSDGLGEGFEQQDFAREYSEDSDDDEYIDEYDYEVASFDWQHDDYALTLLA
jgi:hypothetical protein